MLVSIALAACAGLASPQPASPASEITLNKLLLVDLDDCGFDLLRVTPTPHLDFLEANGRFFTRFTTAPICTPTRAMVNTGAFPRHPDLLMGANVEANGGSSMPLSPLIPLASALGAAGFSTAKIGKWHLAPTNQPNHVLQAGWGSYSGVLSNLNSEGLPWTYDNFGTWTNGVLTRVTDTYLTTFEANEAIARMGDGVHLVSLSFHAPHAPFHVPPAHLHTIVNPTSNRDKARAMLQACDTEFGRVFDAAIQEGYSIIVFSDNGTPMPAGGLKGTLFDGGIVNPMWAYGPLFAPGVDDTLLSAADIYDTVLDLFGVSANGPLRGPNSNSFEENLAGQPGIRRWSYSERFPMNGVTPSAFTQWQRAVRMSRFKLITGPGVSQERLFDLLQDPTESSDLLSGPPLSMEAQDAYDDLQAILATI